MEPKVLEKLRREQSLRELPDGREGIDVTLQFVGPVPPTLRAERKHWLEQHFSTVAQQFDSGLDLKPGSLSVSGQSVEATVPVDDFDAIRDRLSREDVRVGVTQVVKVVDGTN